MDVLLLIAVTVSLTLVKFVIVVLIVALTALVSPTTFLIMCVGVHFVVTTSLIHFSHAITATILVALGVVESISVTSVIQHWASLPAVIYLVEMVY